MDRRHRREGRARAEKSVSLSLSLFVWRLHGSNYYLLWEQTLFALATMGSSQSASGGSVLLHRLVLLIIFIFLLPPLPFLPPAPPRPPYQGMTVSDLNSRG